MRRRTFPDSLLPKDGSVYFFPALFSAEESDRYFDQLRNEIQWKQEPILIFGKPVMQPRLTAWYGDPDKSYRYSGIKMHPQPWTPTLRVIKAKVESVAGHTFTSALLNLYRDGADSMGWHRDNEKELGENPVIASVSLGAVRTFQLRHAAEKALKNSVQLNHGSLLLMQDETQHYWYHRIPKEPRVSAPRINLTFRTLFSR
jgi:alkylated DNA repair dioxygenase AlkB